MAVWSGWVGLGGLCGFGIVHPLPGIWDAARLNTAITLPVGVEAYGAYALGAWFAPGAAAPARVFARRSAIGALALGMAGQIAYHLLAAAHAIRAPWWVVTLVSCLPVVTLAFGAALTHLLLTAADPGTEEGTHPEIATGARTDPAPQAPRTDLDPARTGHGPYGNREDRTATDPGPDPGPGAEVDRDALMAEMTAEILAAAEAGETWRPDYAALMDRSGYRLSWCEKAVRDARRAAARGRMRDGRAEASASPRAPRTAEARTGVAARTGSPGAEAARTDAGAEARTEVAA